MKGWIKLHRKIGENVFLMNDNNAYMVFTKLLFIANSKGEWAGGRLKLAEIMNLNHNTLYKVLKRLKREQLVNINSNSKYSIITICKWSEYQANGNSLSNSMVTTREQHGNTLVRIENKNKENLLVKNEPQVSEKGLATWRAKRAELGL